MQSFPLFLKLKDRKVLVVGGGDAAVAKTRLLLASGAAVTIIAPAPGSDIAAWADNGQVILHQREFHTEDLYEIVLIVISTECPANDARIANTARWLGVPVNVVDRPALSDFTMPAIVERGPVTVAISTGGAAPVLARDIRGRIETALPKNLGALAGFIDQFRDAVKTVVPTVQGRRKFWDRFLGSPVARAVLDGDVARARRDMLHLVNRPETAEANGRLALIGGANADPELLTRKAHRLLQEADLVIHAKGVCADVLDLARRDARRISADAITDSGMQIETAAHPLTVYLTDQQTDTSRLTQSLRSASADFEFVPGINTFAPISRNESALRR